jgi:hypothetical protein
MRNAYKILVREHEWKKLFGNKSIREDNIKFDLRETVYEDMNWSNLPQDRV